MKRKILSLSLAIIMAVMPVAAFAGEIDNKTVSEGEPVQNRPSEENQDININGTTEPEEQNNHNTPNETKQSVFKDVAADAWYADAVNFVTTRGIMNGTSGDMFSPEQSATRGMLAMIINNMEGVADKVYWSYFDVKEDAWYANAVAWCSETGVMKGYGDGKFGPEDSVTREQLVSILYRYAVYKNYSNLETNGVELLNYKDYADVSGYAGGPMQWALKNSIISGKERNLLDPKGVASRAEIAQIIRNFMVYYNV